MMCRMTSLAYTPGARRAVDLDAPDLQRLDRQALRGEHVADLRGADAEGDRAERAVRGRVAVAARDGHARLGQPELRPDDVDDALVAAVGRRRADAELAAVALERRPSSLPPSRRRTAGAAIGRHDVVDGGERALGERAP